MGMKRRGVYLVVLMALPGKYLLGCFPFAWPSYGRLDSRLRSSFSRILCPLRESLSSPRGVLHVMAALFVPLFVTSWSVSSSLPFNGSCVLPWLVSRPSSLWMVPPEHVGPNQVRWDKVTAHFSGPAPSLTGVFSFHTGGSQSAGPNWFQEATFKNRFLCF